MDINQIKVHAMSSSKLLKRKFSESEDSKSDLNSSSDDEFVSSSKRSKSVVKKHKSVLQTDSSSEDESITLKSKSQMTSNSIKTKNNIQDSSDDDFIKKGNKAKRNISKKSKLSKDVAESCSSENKLPDIKKQMIRNKDSVENTDAKAQENSEAESSNEDEPIVKKHVSSNLIISKISSKSSSSEDELSTIKKELSKTKDSVEDNNSELDGNRTKESSDECASSVSAIGEQDLTSDDEKPLASFKGNKMPLKVLQKVQTPSKEKSKISDVLSDEEKSFKKVSKKKKASKKSSTNDKIEHLKKYIRVAGIRIKSYDLLLKDCKSMKAKTEKLLEVLQEKGIKGRPTLAKCKKLKKKIETEQEVSELDTSNIIQTNGRPKRGCITNEHVSNQISASPMKKFSRLKDIIDSEDSE